MFTIDNMKVRFRYAYGFRDRDPMAKPVDTYCEIVDTSADTLLALGIAKCSKSDNPNKAVGRKIAFHRALWTLFPLNRDMRKKFWDTYFQYTKPQ